MHTHSNTMCTCQTQCAHATHVHAYTLKHTTSHSPYTHFRTHAHMPVHLQISYGSSSPTLSDRDMFPTFFRTIPSETQSNSARFAFMKSYNWSKVATLHETRNVFTLVSWLHACTQYFISHHSSFTHHRKATALVINVACIVGTFYVESNWSLIWLDHFAWQCYCS